ncbi:MAG TPA: hypothetical protein VIK78_13405 [Ruminiclostridium sp.]
MKRTIDDMINFFLFEKGKDILVNDISMKAVILDADEKINEDADKIIHCKIEIKTGDKVEYIGQKYLITSQIDKNSNSYSAKIKQCNHKVAFNFNGDIKWFDAIIESKVMNITTNQYMSQASGQIKVTLQNNANSRDIAIGKRFINTARAFKVAGIDKSRNGLITLNCDLSQTGCNDDLENDIADRWLYEITHTYILNINNGSSMKLSLNDAEQINVTITDNGTVMNPLPALTYLSSNLNIVAVDNTGKLMSIIAGTAKVTCKMTYNTQVLDTIDITVGEVLTHVYTLDITGSATIIQSRLQSYVTHFYDSGSEIFDKTAVWTIRNQDGTTSTAYATITASTGNGATLTAGSAYNKYVVLRAALSDDITVFKEFTIKIVSLI